MGFTLGKPEDGEESRELLLSRCDMVFAIINTQCLCPPPAYSLHSEGAEEGKGLTRNERDKGREDNEVYVAKFTVYEIVKC